MLRQTNPLKWENLEIFYRDLKQPRPCTIEKVHAIDTETLNGYARLIADNTGRFRLVDNLDDCLSFLTFKPYQQSFNFWYNLQYDFDAIFKYLPLDSLKTLVDVGEVQYGPYNISYIPKKLFKIRKSKKAYVFYDVAQFFESSLEVAAFKYLGGIKNPDNLDRAAIGTQAAYWEAHREEIIKYCGIDANLTAGLGRVLIDAFKHDIGFTPKSYASKASVSKQYFRTCCNIPNIARVPEWAMYHAYNAYYGGRFEVLEKGNLGECSLIDINSAYPYQIANLLDVSRGKWRPVTEMHEKATYGFYKAVITVTPAPFCPFAYRLPNGVVCYPAGQWVGYVTKEEIEAYRNAADVRIIQGAEFYATEEVYPFRQAIHDLYEQKAKAGKTDFKYNLYKVLMNSLYGCFYEKIEDTTKGGPGKTHKTGILFNPIYATIITANTRIQEYNEALKYGEAVAAFATDSLLLKGKHYAGSDKSLGLFSDDGAGESIVLKAGIYQIAGKTKARGITSSAAGRGGEDADGPIKEAARYINTPHGNFNNLFDYIRQQPKLTEYKIISSRPLHLKECIKQPTAKGHSQINIFTPTEYTININKDFKRLWSGRFNSGGDIYDTRLTSRPLILDRSLNL